MLTANDWWVIPTSVFLATICWIVIETWPRPRWALIAALTFFPVTAILHHAVFHRPTCMLNKFGADYTIDVIQVWLASDPSPYLGVVAAAVVFAVGLRWRVVQYTSLAFLFATIPLSLWIWDIPFTDRVICHLGHDGRAPFSSRHLYALAAITFVPLFFWLSSRSRKITITLIR